MKMLSDNAIIFDTETTGLRPGRDGEGDEILTLSIILPSGKCPRSHREGL